MTINAVDLVTEQFKGVGGLLLQQKGTKIRPYTMSGSHIGKKAAPLDQFGAVQARSLVKWAPKGRSDAPVDRRWVSPKSFVINPMVTEFDELRTLTDIKSPQLKNIAYAMGREWDDEIIDAYHRANLVGQAGTTTKAFNTDNEVDVDSTQLTTDKIKEGLRILKANHVDDSDGAICMIIDAEQRTSLLNQQEVINNDYIQSTVLTTGMLPPFLGVHFIECERLKKEGSNTLVPMFAKSGMYFGVWQDFNVSIKKRYDIEDEPWEAYAKSTFGATRLEENKCVTIKCLSN